MEVNPLDRVFCSLSDEGKGDRLIPAGIGSFLFTEREMQTLYYSDHILPALSHEDYLERGFKNEMILQFPAYFHNIAF